MSRKNIILVTGRTASGKTTYSNTLRRIIPRSVLIADFQFLRDIFREDDATGGHGHRHPVSDYQRLGVTLIDATGHSHSEAGALAGPFPALTTDQQFVIATYARFFDSLAKEKAEHIIIAELGGGQNGHAPESPFALINHSYTTIAHNLENGAFNNAALSHIKLCLHITIHDAVREQRLQHRRDINLDVFKMLAYDDFDGDFARLLLKHQIPIVTFNNDKDLSASEIEELLKRNL